MTLLQQHRYSLHTLPGPIGILLSFLIASAMSFSLYGANRGFEAGRKVGEKIPELTVRDQSGKERDFASLCGSKGLLIVFHRSAKW